MPYSEQHWDRIAILAEVSPRYLEIGVRDGDSLRVYLKQAMTIQRIVLVDNWGSQFGGTGRGSSAHIERLIQDVRPDAWPQTEIATGNSPDVLPSLTGAFDLILVDGDHSEAGAAADLRIAWRLLTVGGSLVFDDIYHPKHPYLLQVANRFCKATADAFATYVSDAGKGVFVMQKQPL
jgi:hypothetical protein